MTLSRLGVRRLVVSVERVVAFGSRAGEGQAEELEPIVEGAILSILDECLSKDILAGHRDIARIGYVCERDRNALAKLTHGIEWPLEQKLSVEVVTGPTTR